MALEFRQVALPPLSSFDAQAPDGALIGIIGEQGCGAAELARIAGGVNQPTSGEVVARGTRRYLGPRDALDLAPVDLLVVDHTLAQADALVRAQTAVALDRLRASGATILLLSHEPVLLRGLADELWWLNDGVLAARGDPRQVLDAYHAHVAHQVRAWGESLGQPLSPALRKGDGRAEIVSIETLGASGKPSMVWQSGELVVVRVAVRFRQAVANPVIGIMIRTRIGLEVYGTNTELEKADIGNRAAGETVAVHFGFRCELCPKEYTITAASHDPDGTAHDWMDDAVAFIVADSRYTAGVANLRATVRIG